MSSPSLRILAIVNLPWEERLGAVRVWAELSEQWRQAGHVVEKFCFTDAFPRSRSRPAKDALCQAIFPHKARQFVRANAPRFDVVDALLGTMPFPKKTLCFPGLLVTRSVGLHRTYHEFERLARRKWSEQPEGKLAGRFFHGAMAAKRWRDAERSLQHADLINVANEDERLALQNSPGEQDRIVVQPYGLTEQNAAALARSARCSAERQERKIVVFIGMWTLRKGSRDWAAIIQRIREQIPEARFRFLGTLVPDEQVWRDLSLRDGIELVREFSPQELPRLLADCSLGVFPSYVEGFGLAVLEQLAAGLPTIAYDAAGPRQILAPLRDQLLAPTGDTALMARLAIQILRASDQEYAGLSQACRELAGTYSWRRIAEETVDIYRDRLRRLSV